MTCRGLHTTATSDFPRGNNPKNEGNEGKKQDQNDEEGDKEEQMAKVRNSGFFLFLSSSRTGINA